MAKKTSKVSTTPRSGGRRSDALAPEKPPGPAPATQPAPTDALDELVMPTRTVKDPAAAPESLTATTSPVPEPPARAPATTRAESTTPEPGDPPLPADHATDERYSLPPPGLAPVPISLGWRFGRNELLALGGFALLGLISVFWFFRYLYPAEVGRLPEVPRQFPQPLKGQLLSLAQADTGWRDRVEADRVRAEEIILPTLRAKLDPSVSSKGFLRIEFLDTEGKIRGDIATVAIEGGRFKDGGRGERVSDDGTEVTVTGTVGFTLRSAFVIYRAGEETRWSVRVREGADYSSGPWSLLGQARVSDRKP